MTTIAEQIARIQDWRSEALARRGELALAVVEGNADAQAALDKTDADIAAADRQLGVLRSAQAAAVARDAAAAAAEASAALAVVRRRVVALVAERQQQFGVLIEAIRDAEAAYDAVRDGVAPLTAELAKLGFRAGDGSALVLGEVGRRLERLLRQRFGRFDELANVRRTGCAVSEEDFSAWLAVEQRLLRVQVLEPALAGSGNGAGE